MIQINVYLVDGRIYEYKVANATKAREHAHRIINYGWRNWEEGLECYYPTWQVLKVTFAMDTKDEMAGKYFAKPRMNQI